MNLHSLNQNLHMLSPTCGQTNVTISVCMSKVENTVSNINLQNASKDSEIVKVDCIKV